MSRPQSEISPSKKPRRTFTGGAYILPTTDVKIWITTEVPAGDDGERAVTTALLPEEY